MYGAAYHGGSYPVNRAGRTIMIPNLSIALLGGVQPDVICSIAEGTDDDGLLQRLIAIILRDSKAGKDVPSPEASSIYDALTSDARTMNLGHQRACFRAMRRGVR